MCAAVVLFVVLYCAVCAFVSGGGAVRGVAWCGAPVCARTTGICTWASTRSMAVSPAWCPACRRSSEWLCVVCALRHLSLG